MTQDKDRPDHPHADGAGSDGRELRPEYKIWIDKEIIEVTVPLLTGRELLERGGKKPAEQYAIYLKVKGGQPLRIALDEKVDLSRPGVERFVTLPLDQTEGFEGRRDFDLPAEDLDWLFRYWTAVRACSRTQRASGRRVRFPGPRWLRSHGSRPQCPR